MAVMVASVPLLTMRIFSKDGTISTSSSAISTSYGLGVPKLVPLLRASAMASRITGLL